MPKALKIACAAALLLVIALVIALLYARSKISKPMIEAEASEALGMEVTVGGRVATGILPGLHVTLGDLRIRNRGAEIVQAKEAQVWIDYLPLLRGEVRFGRITLSRASIAIERAPDGTYNFERSRADENPLPVLELPSVSVSDGTLHYANRQSGDVYDARHCSLEVERLQLLGDARQYFMKRLSATADVACDQFQRNELPASDLKFSAEGKDGVFHYRPVTMRLFGGKGSGTIESDYSKAAPLHHVRYSLPQFRIEDYFKTQTPRKIGRGLMDFEADLTMRGESGTEMKQTMAGRFSLRGNGLTLEGTDIDREFSQYAASQKFNLVDGGAFFLAGPLGLVVTKGYDFAGIFRGSGGSSAIHVFVSDWKVEQGVAQAQDVAFATGKNRVALKGGLDFVKGQFADVTTALIDAKGCAMVKQKIHGSFQKPVVEKPSALEALTGPARRLLKQARDIFPGGECEVFYSGSVAPLNRAE